MNIWIMVGAVLIITAGAFVGVVWLLARRAMLRHERSIRAANGGPMPRWATSALPQRPDLQRDEDFGAEAMEEVGTHVLE